MRFNARRVGYGSGASTAAGAALSVGIHGAGILVAVLATGVAELPPPNSEWGRVIYLAPPPVAVAANQRQTRITYVGINGTGMTAQSPVTDGDGREPVPVADRSGVLLTTVGDEGTPGLAEEEPVFLASQVQNPAAYDPRSAAPAYPEELRTRMIEGQAVVQFVVDSSGTVDTTSFAVLGATHQEFVVAVRIALPRMRFAPAEQDGLRVRQLVQIPFTFRIQPPAPVDSTITPV